MTSDLATLALTALRQKNFAAARAAITAYAKDNPLEFPHYLILGLSQQALSDWAGMLDTFSEATALFPHQAQLWFNLGVAQENTGAFEDAAASLEHSLSLDPHQAEACGNLSNIYRRQGRFAEAEAMAHRAFELGAPKAEALNILGLALGKQGKFENAERIFQEALQLDPNNPRIPANLANLAVDQLNFTAAWPLFAKARAIKDMPIIRRDEGMARMLAGEYAAGWTLYEARLELPAALRIRPPCPRYNGELLAGKTILLIAEQGFGDAIMFFRYGRLLAEAGAKIIWAVPRPLQKLFASNAPGLVVGEDDPLPAADYYLPLLSLPLATRRLLPSEAPTTPYLIAAADPKLPKAKKDMRKIGLVWSGSRTHERDHERSIFLDEFAPLFKAVKAQFYAPFAGDGIEQIAPQTPVTPLDNLIADFADTASLLTQLDCLITVDTAAAHLGGALGVKTCLLLPYCPDWRWGASGEATPWYPSLTLMRQPSYGDWENTINRLIEKLA